ncbi:DUF262 and DUF1524 domain-containing protein (plasmid) [Aliarcobacter cibarius]|uniref:DUF262 domain-containing protein n=1 Tax=Aliarcobacter cibarius TaxID=255507 RepID=UPI001246A4FE|nr:DUF262 domain-containing protein [Aliarcobacter cibarius]QEZ90296.1 DUF262 and DUF1524 domain-containing protein [Aliarcobacter cibarius]
MANKQDIQSFKIVELFKSNNEYRIPIYQRNYAWNKSEVEQLIQDILDFSISKTPYYIGTLVVFERTEKNKIIYETIDGQQRLTTLSILLSVLKNKFNSGIDFNPLLTYESRESSNKTFDLIYKNLEDFPVDCNSTMKDAYKIIQASIKKIKDEEKLEDFTNYLLNNVEILRVSVPEDTDLNHYFEIMNNRGEQLEKHEVLKSNMLSVLEKNERIVFSKIWDACSDMSRYVQYGFSNDKTTIYRELIFGKKWNEFNPKNFDELLSILVKGENNDSTTLSIEDIIKATISFTDKDPDDSKNRSERFTSAINFQNFLLHVLRIMIMNDSSDKKEDIPLDDKRLIESFNPFIDKSFVKKFGFNLLKMKYLFDNYVLKRDYSSDNEDGEWSLKKLLFGNTSAQYNNSFGDDKNNEKIIKLLSMFHVSNPSPIYKHWLTGVLNFLFQKDINHIDALEYIVYLERQAELFLRNRYLIKNSMEYHQIIFNKNILPCKDIDVSLLDDGTNVENFIFNYLDYLLWRNDTENKYSKFNFTFRSSVEHFYPQNPLDGQKRLQDEFTDKDYLNSFGNLCLISASKNSKFSNLQPGGKESHYKGFDGISPKQYLMMQKAHTWWKEEIIEHQKEMLKVLGLNYES